MQTTPNKDDHYFVAGFMAGENSAMRGNYAEIQFALVRDSRKATPEEEKADAAWLAGYKAGIDSAIPF